MEVLDATGRDRVIGLCLNFGMIRVSSLSAFLWIICPTLVTNLRVRFQVWSHGVRFIRVALYPVKLSRVVAQNLFHETRRHVFACSHLRHQMSLLCGVVVTVIGAGE